MSDHVGVQAVVIGAGIAGLSAAQALAGRFEKVVLLDRDPPSRPALPRPGVPQGRQTHLLMAGGFAALRQLFPGLERDLEGAGAVPYDAGRDLRLELPGAGALPKRAFGFGSYAATRPMLEHLINRRVVARDDVELRYGCRAIEIGTRSDGSIVTGVRYEGPDGQIDQIDADLVIDASGRATPTLYWLRANGRPAPAQTTIGVELGYATAAFLIPKAVDLDFVGVATLADAPHSSRSGYLIQLGGGVWQALMVGRGRDRPPSELESFLAFAESLASPSIATALKAGYVVSRIERFGFPESVWRHFHRSPALPAGLLPIGDAICRLNPVYGQGMSIAAQQARLLQDAISGYADGIAGIFRTSRDFLARAERLVASPWATSALPDFVYPSTIGERPEDLQDQLDRQARLFREAFDDPGAHRALIETQHLMKPEGLEPQASLEAA